MTAGIQHPVGDRATVSRTSFDGILVQSWNSGELTTGRYGFAVRGIGRARSRHERDKRRRAAEVVANGAPLLFVAELKFAFDAALREITADLKGLVEFNAERLEGLVFRAVNRARNLRDGLDDQVTP